MRVRKVEIAKNSTRPELAYERKNAFVESSIENTMTFFKANNYLSWTNAASNKIDEIRNKVMKNEAKINKKNGRNNGYNN